MKVSAWMGLACGVLSAGLAACSGDAASGRSTASGGASSGGGQDGGTPPSQGAGAAGSSGVTGVSGGRGGLGAGGAPVVSVGGAPSSTGGSNATGGRTSSGGSATVNGVPEWSMDRGQYGWGDLPSFVDMMSGFFEDNADIPAVENNFNNGGSGDWNFYPENASNMMSADEYKKLWKQ